MASTAQDLLRLKEHIQKAKTEAARVQGQLDQLLEQRGRDFGVSTDEETAQYLQELEEKSAALCKELEDGVRAIKDELEWE